MYEISSYLKQAGKSGEDSLTIFETDDTVLICIADGAGGMSGGLRASRMACNLVYRIDTSVGYESPEDSESLLIKLDNEICFDHEAGETTMILASIKNGVIWGASVGDSECWTVQNDYEYELTKLQYRKPLLGSGVAKPIGFGPVEVSGNIIFGSDGLFKYTTFEKIKRELSSTGCCINNLAKLATQATGYLQDDVSIIVFKSII